MKKRLLLSLCVMFSYNAWAQITNTYLSQDFSTFATTYSSTPANYFPGQPTTVGDAKNKGIDGPLGEMVLEATDLPASTYTITNGALKITKVPTTGTEGRNRFSALRKFIYPAGGTPEVLQLKMTVKLENFLNNGNFSDVIFIALGSASLPADFNSASAGNIITGFRVGSWSDGNAPAPTNSFQLGIINSGSVPTQTTALTIAQNITLVVNNSLAAATYTGPNGAIGLTVASGKSDFWIGNTLVQDEYANVIAPGTNIESLRISGPNAKPGGNKSSYDFIVDDISLTTTNPLTTLPVSLVDFKAKAVDNSVLLNWETASEVNNQKFEILRGSKDNLKFEKIGEVAGFGNSNELKKYAFKDLEPFGGVNYYQLKQIDFDGNSSLSKVVSADSKLPLGSLSVYQDASMVDVSVYSDRAISGKLVITDMQGKRVVLKDVVLNKGNNSFKVNQSFTPGVYVVNVQTSQTNLISKAQFK